MAHAAIAFAKASRRRRMMACTTSIGPGATNMVTAAAVAHVNRLPVLLLPGDVFASRRPDPVLQQVEDFSDGTVSANDCFRPVSRYFDRITRPEQILTALPRALAVLTDPAECGPATLALCQDVQAEAFDYPERFFAERVWRLRRMRPDERELVDARGARRAGEETADRRRRRRALRRGDRDAAALRRGARHSGRRDAGRQERPRRTITRSTWARSASPARAPRTRSRPRPTSCSRSARGCRTSPPAPGRCSATPIRRSSASTCRASMPSKHGALPLVCDAKVGLERLSAALGGRRAPRGLGRARRVREGALARARRRRDRGDERGAAVRRAGDRGGAAGGRAVRHRRLRRRRPAGRAAQAVAGRRSPAATTSNTAIPAWATRSPAASASRWRGPSAR